MAEYHVGAGAFGIYAGTLMPTKDETRVVWRNKSNVTEEAIAAVVAYFKTQLKVKDKTAFHDQYEFGDGTLVNLDIAIVKEKETT